jgi:GT2 family glycosyltransferase
MAEEHRGGIPPVAAGVARPLWSVMIPTYNGEAYLRETLASVLAQDPGPDRMQIEVVDDASTEGDPEAVVRELGRGRVGFHRQPRNVGHVSNFNTCLERARGHLVHLLHGDDCVREGFYGKLQRLLEQHPEAGAAFCRVIVMDERGHWRHLNNLLQRQSGLLAESLRVIASKLPVETPSIVVRRAAYERLGGFDPRFRFCGEDLEMWVRVAAHYPVAYEPEPLALYRKHTRSLSGVSIRTGQNIRDAVLAIDTFAAYLPQAIVARATRRSKEKIALWALDLARLMTSRGDLVAARAQLREALRCSRSRPVLLGAGAAASRLVRRTIGQSLRSRGTPSRGVPDAAASGGPE